MVYNDINRKITFFFVVLNYLEIYGYVVVVEVCFSANPVISFDKSIFYRILVLFKCTSG